MTTMHYRANEESSVWSADQIAGCTIYIPAQPDSVLDFAAHELSMYLHRLTGACLAVRRLTDLPTHWLLLAAHPLNFPSPARLPDPGSFALDASRDAIVVRGGSSTATLHGVYSLLEQLGCAWSVSGRLHEIVPTHRVEHFPFLPTDFSPCFQSVAYCSDIVTWHYTQPELLRERVHEDLELADWMAKTGATRFFFIRHPFDSASTIRELQEAFATRGISVEVGGHILPLLLRRDWFVQHPEYFPATGQGERTNLGNMCASQPRARELIANEALEFVAETGPVAALHLWGADVLGAAWCRCKACEQLTPQEQSLLVCNAVAERFEREGLRTPVYYLAYHDTMEPRLRFQPHPQVWCEFAPRERCYGHSLGDPRCGTNRYYYDALYGYRERFAGRVRAFEYYGDAILFFGCLVAIPRVIARDLATYHAAGVKEISFLQFGQYSRWAYACNFAAFAAAARGRKPERALHDLCKQWHDNPEVLEQAFRSLEELSELLVRYGDVRLKPKRRVQQQELRAALTTSLPRFATVAAEMESVRSPRLLALSLLIRYTQTIFEGVAHELETGSNAAAIFARALKILEPVDRTFKGVWGNADLAVIHDLYAAAAHLPGWG
ncbi:MAG: DUF4838 domain-containing protein [Candidatus Binatia bacterium]|nr:DUF4838 domain-containing protein [Candidatus Binatia bacterium]